MIARTSAVLLTACLLCALPGSAEDHGKSIAEMTEGMQPIDGFVPLHWDAGNGKLYAEIGRFDEELQAWLREIRDEAFVEVKL